MPFNTKRPHGTDLNIDGNITENGDLVVVGVATFQSRVAVHRLTIAYGTSVSIDASLANEFDVTAIDGNGFTVLNPLNPTDGQRITITIRNTSSGALGGVVWDTLYRLAAWTSPSNGNSRSIDFRYDGTNWIEVGRTPNDVPN